MTLTIDNLDGRGAVDYSAALSADAPLKVERALNVPSRCAGALVLAAEPGLTVPVRRARVVVSARNGTVLFTGYIATDPVAEYVGTGLAGPVYRIAFDSVSDEWLLDKQSMMLGGGGFTVDGSTLLAKLAERTAEGQLSTTALTGGNAVGVFVPQPAAPWSTNASGIAAASYAAYRAIEGGLSLQTVGAVTHALDFDSNSGGGTLQAATLKAASVKELANDVTLSGEIEPGAFVTELFSGDGTTSIFQLSEAPFHVTRPTLLSDSFSDAAINAQLWDVTDPGSHLSPGAGGLTMSGGTGTDGQTVLAAIDQIEMGGSLVVESASVQLATPSDGVLSGLYSGPVLRANCFAGWNVRQTGGNTVATPLVNGIETGTSYTLLDGHGYTLRMRLHAAEVQRVRQTYYARVDGAIESFGGGAVDSPMSLVFDLLDLGDASNAPATVLYDGAAPVSPASCTLSAVNSASLTGSLGACSVTQNGSAWIVSTLPGGTRQTRLIGVAGEGADCTMSATGKVTFLAGRIPVAGEVVTVLYRTRGRAVARLEDAASIAAEAEGGMPGTARWLGKVIRPVARSSEDCEAAAQTVLALATSRAAAISGSYNAINPADVWPGDVLAITANGATMSVVVRTVAIVDGHAMPELLTYRINFANDWADSLGITLSEAIAADATLPATALTAPAQVLANLTALAVTNATTSEVQIDAGTDPPTGGGFEVRRADFAFGVGAGIGMVLRSPVRSFSIPRAAQVETFYVRMFDGSSPQLYSRHSSAIITNLPIA